MSRLGKRPINISQGIEANIDGNKLHLKGPKGQLELSKHPAIELKIEDSKIYVSPANKNAILHFFSLKFLLNINTFLYFIYLFLYNL